MLKMIKYIVAAVLLYLVFLLVSTPAAWLVKLAPIPNNVMIAGVSGTLWQGSAQQVKIDGRTLEQVNWTLNPWALFGLKADLGFQFEGEASGSGKIAYTLSGLAVEQLRIDASLPWLVGQTRLPFRTKIAGDAMLTLRDSQQGQPWCERLQGRLLVNQLDVNNQFGQFPLGNIAGTLACQDGLLALNLDEAENQLGLKGDMLLQANTHVDVKASIRATDTMPEQLKQALSFIGRPDASGAYPIQYNGAIPGL